MFLVVEVGIRAVHTCKQVVQPTLIGIYIAYR